MWRKGHKVSWSRITYGHAAAARGRVEGSTRDPGYLTSYVVCGEKVLTPLYVGAGRKGEGES